ncbi:Hypothetical protein CAP_0517 [Chondromyces apiculatus DSM 436]|uniref:VCBS repeat-containing protein n=1 Tax=Chondromyces apiculatus DSM 436 TaxID=1192034 RepID=A0A017SVD7_9BACT|nr:Hypothetical protein CAP_0517 [Chondromyces apiculatus DSM 436]
MLLVSSAVVLTGCLFSRIDVPLPAPASGSQSMAVGDLDGDGVLDLVVTHNPAGPSELRPSVSALLSDGDGDFTTRSTSFGDRTARRVLLGDVDEDGAEDLVILGRDADGLGPLTLHLGQGDGSFTHHADLGLVSPGGIATGDVDGDGHLDLVVSDADANRLLFFFGEGDGTFAPAQHHDGLWGHDLALDDLDGDGDLDVLVLKSQVHVLRNARGSFHQIATVQVAANARVFKLFDLDADGARDLVVVDTAGNAVDVHRGLGGGTFAAPQHYPVGQGPEDVTAADIDRDGRIDLLTANQAANTVTVLRGALGSIFTPERTLRVGVQPARILTADVTGDGKRDIVTANRSGSLTILAGSK